MITQQGESGENLMRHCLRTVPPGVATFRLEMSEDYVDRFSFGENRNDLHLCLTTGAGKNC